MQDTGIGIAEEDRERIFDRFFTVDKSHSGKNGGFGLGLSVVKKLCKKAGWWIGVESEVGKGSTFTVRFPAERRKSALFAEKAKNLLILQGADGIMKAVRSFRAAFSSPSGRLRGQGARL